MPFPDPLGPFLDLGACVLDGGLATELERRGADLRDPLWSAKALLESPNDIVDVHLSYFEAGADVAITASYQASETGFATRGVDRAGTEHLLRRSVELAREAVGRWAISTAAAQRERPSPLVAASVGPYGAVLADGSEYRGDYGVSRSFLVDFHLARLDPLVAAGPDLLAVETIPSSVEIEAIVEALALLGHPIPAWCSVTLRDGSTLADGAPLLDAISPARSSPSMVALGVNCCSSTDALQAVQLLGPHASMPVVAYPNRGGTWEAHTHTWVGDRRSDMGAIASQLWQTGARIVGGCCGTGPDDVRSITRALAWQGVGHRASS